MAAKLRWGTVAQMEGEAKMVELGPIICGDCCAHGIRPYSHILGLCPLAAVLLFVLTMVTVRITITFDLQESEPLDLG